MRLADSMAEASYFKFQRKIKIWVGKLTSLKKFPDGEAKDVIKHCIHLTPDNGYNTSITLLNKRYGNPHHY